MEQLTEQKSTPKFFYGWVVVACILCMQGAATGIINNTMSVFIRPVSEDLGVTRSTFYLYNTFGQLSGMCAAPFWGEFFKNRRFKPFMVLGCFTVATSVFGYSFATRVQHFYAIAIFNSTFQGMLVGVPIARILANWFIEKRGFATGIALSGSGLAGSIMTPIVSRTIETAGWRTGYRLLGVTFFLITVPIVAFVLKERPEDVGQKPLGYKEESDREMQASAAGGPKSGISRSQAFRSKTYWCYVIGLFLVNGCTMATSNNVVNHLTDIGYSPAFAASIFSILLFMLVPGKPLLGYVYDRFGLRAGTILITVMMGVSPIILACTAIFRSQAWIPYFFALWFGLAYSIGTMQLPYMTPKLFGDKEFTRVYGVCQPFTQMGMALLVPLANRAQESIGSYIPVFFTLSVGLTLALFLMLISLKQSPIETEKFDREDGILPSLAPMPASAS